MNEVLALLLVVGAVVLGLGLIVWLLYLAAGIVLAFTVFVEDLPIILILLLFILFPPSLIVYLVGRAFIYFDVGKVMAEKSAPTAIGQKERIEKGYGP